ncbi:response regulator [Roseiconus nitratireducens]|uniref:histidine kinase n=1 Tax=Roseiconus nitratireducens TaxID=2605748 RepID=A0A5M6DEB0_9BACT|nr:response regulator [Roseiconus nitratireducens]KAA5544499.1 response regulator [Roseiconus nitratireducens]
MGDLSTELSDWTDDVGADGRVLMIPLSPRDRRLTEQLFSSEGISVQFCCDMTELCNEVARGSGVLVLHHEQFRRYRFPGLLDFLTSQPRWSDLPVVFVTDDHESLPHPLEDVGNVTVLHKPLHSLTFLSVVRACLTSRRKQYQLRDMLRANLRARAELEENDRRKDEFLATLAHELRNPLAPIQNSLDLLSVEQVSLREEHQLREIMTRQVKQLSRIVDDLLDVSRITRGKIKLVRSTIDLRDSILAGIEASAPFIRQSDQTLNVDLGELPMPVYGDSARLSQVIANLLNNAAKYTPAGGTIWVETFAHGGLFEVAIRDDGIGIDSDQIDSVFDLFTQHDIERERGQAGLGIGLTLVKRLLELHGGSVRVESDGLGTGSTFVIRMPRDVEVGEPGATCLTSAAAIEAERCFRVLVVEDTRAIRYVLSRLLQTLGHTVEVAENGAEGLAIARQSRPELIISDISMPKMNGYQLACQIRNDPAFDRTMLVAMTGYGREEDRNRALAHGFNAHLTKPVDLDSLRKLLAAL